VIHLDHQFTSSRYEKGRNTTAKGAAGAANSLADWFDDYAYDGMVRDYTIEAIDIDKTEFDEAMAAGAKK